MSLDETTETYELDGAGFSARLRAHAAAYPPFAASLEAQGCGRVVGD